MSNSPIVAIDASAFAIPSIGSNRSDVETYLENVAAYKKLLSDKLCVVHISHNTVQCLCDDNEYPNFEKLDELINIHGLDEVFDADIVNRMIEEVLECASYFEDAYQLFDVLIENFTCEPDLLQFVNSENIRENLKRIIVLSGLLRHRSCPDSENMYLVLKNAKGGSVKFRVQIHEFEHKREDISNIRLYPYFFDGEVFVCLTFEDFINLIEDSNILVNASDIGEVELSIKIALFKNLNSSKNIVAWEQLKVPAIRDKFFRNCQKICSSRESSFAKKILKSIVNIVFEKNPRKSHAFRTKQGGSSPKLREDSRIVKRESVDRSCRIHYTIEKDGTVNLLSVGEHDDEL